MRSSNIRVEIVTPVHNRREITLQCLRSIEKLDSDGLEIHTIVVDDGSTDGTAEAIKRDHPNVQIVAGDGNLWFTEGTNVGVRAALKHQPDYILTINDDQVFDPQSLKFLIETAEKHDRAIVGSLLLLWDTPHKLFQVSPQWSTKLGGWRHWYQQTVWTIPEKPWEVDLIVGNCVLFPVEAIREVGLMDSKRYPNFGDAEYTPRLRKRGWKLLIEPRARVFCQPNNIPAKVTKLTLGQKFNSLFIDLGHIHNLRRRLYSNLDGAPNKISGFAAFCIFFCRLLLGKNTESAAWGDSEKEEPLKSSFSHRVVSD